MTCDFSIRHYCEVLEKATKTHSFYTFKDFPKTPSKRYILLRHDVDVQPEKALQMAVINHQIGIPSTFFFRMHGSYNLFQQKALIERIARLGHEVGFHYEPMFYLIHKLLPSETLLEEIRLFQKRLNIKVKSVAAHLPSIMPFPLGIVGTQYLDAYSSPFFNEIKYISDSNKVWREGCMCKWIELQPRLQILVHPHWWDGISLQEYAEKYGVL